MIALHWLRRLKGQNKARQHKRQLSVRERAGRARTKLASAGFGPRVLLLVPQRRIRLVLVGLWGFLFLLLIGFPFGPVGFIELLHDDLFFGDDTAILRFVEAQQEKGNRR